MERPSSWVICAFAGMKRSDGVGCEDINHTSRAKPFQSFSLECFHCEPLWLGLDGSEKRF